MFIIAISLYFSCYKVNIIEFSSNKPGNNILIIGLTQRTLKLHLLCHA